MPALAGGSLYKWLCQNRLRGLHGERARKRGALVQALQDADPACCWLCHHSAQVSGLEVLARRR